MTTDNRHIDPVTSALEQAAAPVSATDQGQFIIAFYKIVGEASKYTVFAIFVLYCIGFIIWHSYLGSYGVSIRDFLESPLASSGRVLCRYARILTLTRTKPIFTGKSADTGLLTAPPSAEKPLFSCGF